jgi:hypothetical protein
MLLGVQGLMTRTGARTPADLGHVCSVSEKWVFACTNRNMQHKMHRSATTYSVQNSISDTLSVCPGFIINVLRISCNRSIVLETTSLKLQKTKERKRRQ